MKFVRFAVIGALSYLFWRNRFKVQQFVESKGVSTPLLKGNLGETLKSGFARVAGRIQHENKQFKESA